MLALQPTGNLLPLVHEPLQDHALHRVAPVQVGDHRPASAAHPAAVRGCAPVLAAGMTPPSLGLCSPVAPHPLGSDPAVTLLPLKSLTQCPMVEDTSLGLNGLPTVIMLKTKQNKNKQTNKTNNNKKPFEGFKKEGQKCMHSYLLIRGESRVDHQANMTGKAL